MSDHNPLTRATMSLLRRRAVLALVGSAVLGGLLAGAIAAATPTANHPVSDATPVVQAFERDRNAADTLTDEAADQLAALTTVPAPSEELAIGTPTLDDSRRIWHGDLGDMFVVPMSTGYVCYVIVPDGQSGCTDGTLLKTGGVDWGLFDADGLETGEPTTIYGLTQVGVTRVAIVSNAGSEELDLQDGAFLGKSDGTPQTIVFHTASGKTATVALSVAPTR